MLENQKLEECYESIERKEYKERSITKTILLRILCFAVCILLIWQGYGVFENLAEKTNIVEGVKWVIPLSSNFDYEAQDAYIIQKNLKKIGLDLLTKEEEQKYTFYSYYTTYLGVKDKDGKVIIEPKYNDIWIDEEEKYIIASFYNDNDEDKGIYADLKNIVHYYNFDGSDYVKGDYCEGWFFRDNYAVVEVPWEESEDMYFKKKILVINKEGEIVYESPYNNVCQIPGLEDCFIVYNNREGHGLAMLSDDKKGIANVEGEILVPLEYFSIEPCEEQQVIYLTKTDENNGNEILYCMDYQFNPIEVDEIWQFRANNRFEYVNPLENTIDYKPQETMNKEDIFKNARTVYEDEKGWHIANGNKEIIADFPDCIRMYDFSEGISVAEYEDKTKYIDPSGNVLFEIKKPKDYDMGEEYMGHICWYGTIQFAEHKSSFLGKDYKIGLLDKTGKALLPAEFDYIKVINSNGNGNAKEAIVEKNGKYGVVKIMQ